LLASATLIKKPEGVVVFRRGEPPIGVFLILKGSVSLRVDAEDGSTIVDRMVACRDIVGLAATLTGHTYSLTAMTLEQSALALIAQGP